MKDYKQEKEYLELQEKANKTYQEYLKIDKELDTYIEKRLEEEYGDKFCCEYCRFNAFYDFSGDGWHNKCGHYSAPCTCCNSFCTHYQPDNELTKWIKDTQGSLRKDILNALHEFKLYPFDDKSLTKEKIEFIKKIIMKDYD